MVTEGKYRSLGLKYLGADETSDQLSSINWLICGSEYIMLVDRKGLVRDVIAFPAHSKKSPAFSSYCKLNGKDLPDIFVGVLNAEVTGDQLPALSVWKIDLKGAKFVKASTDGLRCPRNAIYHRRWRPLTSVGSLLKLRQHDAQMMLGDLHQPFEGMAEVDDQKQRR